MKKAMFMFMLSLFLLCGCADETVTAECDVITIRPYSNIKETGLFTTKTIVYDYIEYTYEYDGVLCIDSIETHNIDVGDETKVIVEEFKDGYIIDDLQLSLEDYKKIYALSDWGVSDD